MASQFDIATFDEVDTAADDGFQEFVDSGLIEGSCLHTGREVIQDDYCYEGV